MSNKFHKNQASKESCQNATLGNELKLSQYADDTNLLPADLASVEKALKAVENVGTLAGLKRV